MELATTRATTTTTTTAAAVARAVTAPRRLSRTQQTEANRAALLGAAAEVFRERGYAASTLEQIADAAGFSKGVVYSQFASKADLFLHVLDRRIEARAEENQAAVDAGVGDPDTIVRELQRLMSRSDPRWRLAVTEFRLAASRDPDLLARYDEAHRRTIERLAAVLDQIYERTGFAPPVPTKHLAVTILALDVGTIIEDASTTTPVPTRSLDVLLRRMVFGA